MRRAYRAPSCAGVLAALLLGAGLAGCADSSATGGQRAEAVEIALYVAIQNDDPRIVLSGGADLASLRVLYDISCREAALKVWACEVLLEDQSRVSCTIDRVEGDDSRIGGRIHCKR
jgi:hypothetical protein